MATNELLQKRFIYGKASEWYGVNNANKQSNEEKYAKSIVFIKNDTNDKKGDAIFAQGAYFEMNNATDVENIINSYLKEGKNIDIAVDEDSKLVIGAVSLASIDKLAEEDKEKLVEAQAVKDALTTPVELTLTLKDGVASFAESFKTLEGGDKTATATTAVLKQGDIISFTNDGGLKISHATITQATDVKTTETLSTTDKSFDTVSYSVDAYGHVTGKTINTVTLPDTAFVDTQYEVTMTAGNPNEVSLNTKKDGQAENTYTIKGDKGTTVSFENGVMTISSDTAETILSGLDVTDSAVENQYVSEVDQTNGQISVTRTTLPVYGVSETVVDGLKLSLTDGKVGLVDDGLAADLTSKNITLETAQTATEGYLKTYVLKQGTTEIGKIDLPKELVVTSGEVVEKEDGEKYLRLTIANQDTPVDIAVKDLVDVYTAGNGIAISDANVVSAKVKEEDPYLKLGAEGLYTDGIDTAISNAINALDVTESKIGSVAKGTDIVNVIDSLTWSETDGKVSISGTTTSAATKTYVDNAIAALDVTESTVGTKNANDEGNTVTVIDQIIYSETDGKVSISASTTTAATKTYVDGVIEGLDSNLGTALNNPISGEKPEDITGSNDQLFTKIVITDGKLDVTNSTVANVDKATLVDYQTKSTEKYVGLTTTDTIHGAFAKCEEAWDWGTI